MSERVTDVPQRPFDAYSITEAAGSHECQGIVLAIMDPSAAYTVKPIHALFMKSQGPHPAWKVQKNGPHNYIRKFAEEGLTTEERVAANTPEGNTASAYRITDRGINLARPLVGHLLDFSLNVEPSLIDMLGKRSNTPTTPSSKPRIQLMDILTKIGDREFPVSDLALSMGMQIAEASILVENLVAKGIISQKSSGRGNPTVRFTGTPELADIRLRKDAGSLMHDVVSVMQKHFVASPGKELTNFAIASELIKSYGYDLSEEALVKKVSNKTNQLKGRGVIKATRDIDAENARGVVWANKTQLKVMRGLLAVIDGFSKPGNEDFMAEGSQKADIIVSDPGLVNHLVGKAKKASGGFRASSDEHVINRTLIKDIVSDASGPVLIEDISRSLLRSGRILTRGSITAHVNELVESGDFSTSKTKKGLMCQLAQQTES